MSQLAYDSASKSFPCVRRRKRHLNAPPKCLSSHTSHAFASFFGMRFFFQGGGGGLVFTHVGWLKYLSYSVQS